MEVDQTDEEIVIPLVVSQLPNFATTHNTNEHKVLRVFGLISRPIMSESFPLEMAYLETEVVSPG